MSDDIGKLADEVIGRMKTTKELKTVPFEMYARVLDRAVKAEAELKVMREALQGILDVADGKIRGAGAGWRQIDAARAALNRSPAGREG